MWKNYNLIKETKKLHANIDKLKKEFSDPQNGGSKRLKEIQEKTQERERLMDQIEEAEVGGTMPSSSIMQGQENGIEMDPQLAREIQHKRQYVERLRAQLKGLKEDNEALAQQHYQM